MDQNAVFTVEFDKEKFVNNVSEAIKSSEKFEDKMEALSKSADKINFSKPISQLHKFKEELTSAFKAQNGHLGLSGDQINKSVDNIVKSGPKIKEFLNALKKDLKSTTDPEAFKTLRDSITLTENALAELTGEEVKNETVTKSAKARLREMKQELIELEDAGLDDTEMFRHLTIESARLTDQIGDQAEQIRVLSSDTFGLDAGVDLLNQLAAGWQLTEGAMQLFGISTEQTEEQMQKLVAIQSVMNGFQEIHAFLTGQSAAKLALLDGWNKAVAISTALVATVTGEATVATRVFSTALAATGIGAIVIALGLLIANWEDVSDAVTGASDATRAYEKATQEAKSALAGMYEEQIKQKLIFESIKNGSLSAKEALKQYNESIKDTGYSFTKLSDAERFFNSTTDLFIKSALARETALNLIKDAANIQSESLTKTDVTFFESLKGIGNEPIDLLFSSEAREKRNKKILAENKKDSDEKAKQRIKLAIDQQKIVNQTQAEIDKKFKANGATKIDDSKKNSNGTKEAGLQKPKLENIYKELLNDFNKELTSLNNVQKEGLSAINAAAEQNDQERVKKINDALKDKKITGGQAGDLRNKIGLIKNAEIQTETKKFNEERMKAVEQADKELYGLQTQWQASHNDLMEDGYQKDLVVIEASEKANIRAIEDVRAERLEKIKELQNNEFISGQEAGARIIQENYIFEKLITDTKLKANKERLDANTKYQQALIDSYEEGRDLILSYLKVEESDELLALNQKRQKGLITEEKYQNEKLKIQNEYAEKTKQSRITAINEEIQQLEQVLSSSLDSEVQKNTADKINNLKIELSNLLTKENTKDIPWEDTIVGKLFGWDPDNPKDKDKIEAVQKLVQQTIQTSIDLLKEQARLEVEAYDRAISLQQGRVNEARKIADAGNAEYLQQETDRLNQLEAKREQSARRQLEIDQAVQASQILVAVAGAAAQIAKGGTVNVITGIASVIAAIGTGISLVNQMKSSAPKFYDGTEYVELNGNPDGRDTVPAWLNKGERIVPHYINEQLKGIKNKDLPKLVNGELFYNHMIQVNDKDLLDKNDNSNLEKRLQNLEIIQTEQLEYLKALGINIVMDSEGFAASLETASIKKKKMFNA